MAPTQMELLAAAKQVDNTIHNRHVKINKAIIDAGQIQAVEAPPVSELKLDVAEVDDPFGGNINNRNVAKRIAQQRDIVNLTAHERTHTGDPAKARADIAKSLAFNPDAKAPVKDVDAEAAHNLTLAGIKPTPGSPAAEKATQTKAPASAVAPGASGAPAAGTSAPVWKSNA